MFVYDENMTTVLGAFTSANNKDYETFSTAPTKGNVTIIEYFEPYNVEFNGEISILSSPLIVLLGCCGFRYNCFILNRVSLKA